MASLTNEPETFQHYQVMRREDGTLWELGRGAMGVTYKAFDTNLRAPVALKVINALHLDSETARARFVREARAAAGLRHRNVASVYHLGHDDQSFFYAMEFVDGDTVEGLVKSQGVLKPVTALQIALQVSRALGAAAKQQLVHRDIKPANLMVVSEDDEDDQFAVKVIDFGLARPALGGEGSAHITMGGFVGTPQYASPEQLEEKELDARSDIYSLGITLWYMLAGKPPFVGALGSVFIQQLTKEPPWDQLAGTPKPVTDLLALMLAKEPERRPQSPTELRRAIEVCLKKLPAESGRIVISHEGSGIGNIPTAVPTTSTLTQEVLATETPLTATPTETDSAVLTSVPTTAPGTGTILAGRFALDYQVGEGSNGRVFRARDLDHGNAVVAVKIFHRGILETQPELTRLETSLEKLRNAPHPHLLRFQKFRRIGDVKFLAGDWVKGFTLVDLLRARGKVSPKEAFALLEQAAQAADLAQELQMPGPELALHQIMVDFPDEPLDSDTSTGTTTSGTKAYVSHPVDQWPRYSLKLDATGIIREVDDAATLAGDMTMLSGRPALDRDTQSSIRGLVADSHVFSLAALAYELLNGSPPPAHSHEEGRDTKYVALSALNEAGNAVLRKALSANPDFATSTEFIRELARASGFGAERPAVDEAPSGEDSAAAETLVFSARATPSWATDEASDSSAETLVHHEEPSAKDERSDATAEITTARFSAPSEIAPQVSIPPAEEADGSEAATLQGYSFVSRGKDVVIPVEVDPADPRNPVVEKDDYGADGSDAPTLQGYSFKSPPAALEEVKPPMVEVVRDTYGLDDVEAPTLQDFSFKAPPAEVPSPIIHPLPTEKSSPEAEAPTLDGYRFEAPATEDPLIVVARGPAEKGPEHEAAEPPELEAPTLQGYDFKSAGAPDIEITPAALHTPEAPAVVEAKMDVPETDTPETDAPTLEGYRFKTDAPEVILPSEIQETASSAVEEDKFPAPPSDSETDTAPTLLDYSFKDAAKREEITEDHDSETPTLLDVPLSPVPAEPVVAKAPEPPALHDEFLTIADAPLPAVEPLRSQPEIEHNKAEEIAPPDERRVDQAEVSLDPPLTGPAPVTADSPATTERPGIDRVTPFQPTPKVPSEPVFTDHPILEETEPKKLNFALIGTVAAVVVLGVIGASLGLRGKSPQPSPVLPAKIDSTASRDRVADKPSNPPSENLPPTATSNSAVVVQPTATVENPTSTGASTSDPGLKPLEGNNPTAASEPSPVAANTGSSVPVERVRPPASTPASTHSSKGDEDDEDTSDYIRRHRSAPTPRPVQVAREPKPTPERVIKREPPRSDPPKVASKPPPPKPTATPAPVENRPRGPAVPFMR